MNSSRERERGRGHTSIRPGYVIRRDDTFTHEGLRAARLNADLASTEYVAPGVADPRLVDPYLAELVEAAREEARKAGYAQGRAEGFEAGRQEGLDLLAAQQRELVEQDAAERAARKERLIHLLTSVEDAIAVALDYQAPAMEELRDLVATVGVEVAEELVGHHLQVRDCAARDAVMRALQQVPRRASVTLRLHPDDLAYVEEISGQVTDWTVARVLADSSLSPGDAVAEADNLEVDATLNGAIERVRAVLNQ
ncbi:FliH/SctL family protein [Gephyromycinifex aptenodytis]|uniref:FliH/SctL family protein n=1 Tax=Gephyromycinifex aptenodytis TaxID=2716227 RepID=UPI0014462EF1|nr:FliH/SctL family protein [Gephyromycinifex aptenodytis]